jgi:hypothetical protein
VSGELIHLDNEKVCASFTSTRIDSPFSTPRKAQMQNHTDTEAIKTKRFSEPENGVKSHPSEHDLDDDNLSQLSAQHDRISSKFNGNESLPKRRNLNPIAESRERGERAAEIAKRNRRVVRPFDGLGIEPLMEGSRSIQIGQSPECTVP